MKEMEGPMIRHADKIVCLTKRASHLLANWYLNHDAAAANRFQVIPCCADFAHFDVERVSPADSDAARARAGLKSDDFVLLYLGSLGPDYLLPQMMALFREVLAVKPQAVFLFLSNNGQELVEAECAKQNIPIEQIRFLSSDRNEIPAYIGLASLSVFFIRNDYDKIGCSPTKLAELFACNVPVIANSGVGDLDDILDLGRNNSIVINDFAEPSLREAVNRVISIRRVGRVNIRQNSYEFALDEGVARYAAIYRELGA
jgi:glycosyltransferase involved in cell wall biosynthesis